MAKESDYTSIRITVALRKKLMMLGYKSETYGEVIERIIREYGEYVSQNPHA